MNNKLQIVETPDYILGVSDEETKQTKDYHYNPYTCTIHQGNWMPELKECKKIIAYQLKGNAKELDLPLLPEMVVEDDVKKLPYEQLCYYDARNPNNALSHLQEGEPEENSYQEEGVDFAAKGCMCDNCFYGRTKLATQIIDSATKVYSEDEAIGFYLWVRKKYGSVKPVEEGCIVEKTDYKGLFHVYIKSLNQTKIPKWFIAEMETNYKPKQKVEDIPYEDVLQTPTINGKTYLVGKYLNE